MRLLYGIHFLKRMNTFMEVPLRKLPDAIPCPRPLLKRQTNIPEGTDNDNSNNAQFVCDNDAILKPYQVITMEDILNKRKMEEQDKITLYTKDETCNHDVRDPEPIIGTRKG